MINVKYYLAEVLEVLELGSFFPGDLREDLSKLLAERGNSDLEKLASVVFAYIRFELGAKLLHLQMKENTGGKKGEEREGRDSKIAACARELSRLLQERKPSPLRFILPGFFFIRGNFPDDFPDDLRRYCLDGSKMEDAFMAILERLYEGAAYHEQLHMIPIPFHPDELNDLEQILQEPRARGQHASTFGINFKHFLYVELAELLGKKRGLYSCMEELLVFLESNRELLLERSYIPEDIEYFQENDLLPQTDKNFFLPNASDEDEAPNYRRGIENGTREGRKQQKKRKNKRLPFSLVEFSPTKHLLPDEEEEEQNSVRHPRRRLQPRRAEDIH